MLNNLWDQRSKDKYGVAVRTADYYPFHNIPILGGLCQERSDWDSKLWMNVSPCELLARGGPGRALSAQG